MWRWIAALTLVTGPWLAAAQAQQLTNYVRIKIDLNEYKVDTASGAAKPGGNPGGGNPKVGQPGGTPTPAGEESPLWVEIHLPVQAPQNIPNTNLLQFQHSYSPVAGKPGVSVTFQEDAKLYAQYSPKIRFDALKNKAKANELSMLGLAKFALERGLLKEFVQTMEEFDKKFDKHPVAAAFSAVHKKIKDAPKQDDPSAAKLNLQDYSRVASPDGHYALYTKLPVATAAVKTRLRQLDRTYQSFYYWFALHQKVVPQPNHRLIVVLESSGNDFRAKSSSYTAKPIADAGFLAQGQNVIFLSTEPIDPIFAYLQTNNKLYYKELALSPNDFLTANIPPGKLDNDNAAKLSTRALVEKVLVEDSARATTTHQAVQQLLAASNLLPRNVLTAEWLRYGLSSFFDTPRLAFYDGTALPSWTNLVNFVHHRDTTKKFSGEQKAVVLYKTITDEYFSQANIALQLADNADDRLSAYLAAMERLQLAEASAWSLAFYLMNNKLDNVFAYCDQVRQLPREIEYSPPVLATCFGRAFSWPAGNPADPIPLNLQNLDQLGGQWYTYINPPHVTLDVTGLESDSLQSLAEPPKKKMPPMPGGAGN